MATEGTGAKAARDLGQGWKISPSIRIKTGQTALLGEIQGEGALQHIWMTPTGTWRYSILRIYWDGGTEPSVEAPVGDFFASGWGGYAPISSLGTVRRNLSGLGHAQLGLVGRRRNQVLHGRRHEIPDDLRHGGIILTPAHGAGVRMEICI
jgi:hypothetical protein